MSRALIALALVLAGLVAARPARAENGTGAAAARRATDAAAARVRQLAGEQKTWLEAKRALDLRYRKQLADIDELKRHRSSWRRNRELRAAYAESQTTARKLAVLDQRVREYAGRLRSARARLLDRIDAELGADPEPARRAWLAKLRASEGSKVRRPVRPIALPDDRIDPLATSDELREQAEILRRSALELAQQVADLERREERFAKMVELRERRARASELAAMDDNSPRRTTAHAEATRGAGGASISDAPGAGDTAGPAEPSAPAPGTSTDQPPTGSDLPGPDRSGADYAVILSDVVDAPTLSAYRAGTRSADPARKAAAARALRLKAQERLQRLERQRLLMLEAARRRSRHQ